VETAHGFDPFDNAQQVPWEWLAGLRSECPVGRLDTGQHLFTRYDDVHEALRDGGERLHHFAHEGGMRAPGVIVPEEEQLINEIDGSRHSRRRKLLMTALHPRLIAAAEPYIRDLSGRLLGSILARGSGDLVSEFTQPLPGMVFAHVLGLPEDHYPRFKAWGEEVLADTYPTLNRTVRGEGLHGAHPEFSAYIDSLVDARRRHPRHDLISRMAQPDDDGDVLSDTEIRVTVMFLIIAGHETTTHLLGNLLEYILTDRAGWERLKADPSLIPKAVEESLRRDPPVVIQPATCIAALRTHGRTVEPGERVVLSIASANRDDTVYVAPDAFVIDRAAAPVHTSFGGGAHFCPGAPLARLEARVALEEFVARVASAVLEPGYRRSKVPVFWANGPSRLPVTVTAPVRPAEVGRAGAG
jgi:cytochrome P450